MIKNPTNRNLFTTVFITGAAVLIIEIAAVRILSPFYGSSLYVLSSVLTVILAALSFGYWYGGKRADREKSIDALYSIISISGLWVLGLLLLSQLLLPTLGHFFSSTVGPLLFSLGLFFIPAFLLGIVSPYVIKIQSLTNSIENIGGVVGATFFWGTAGSIFGSLATGFVFIPLIGVTKTIILVSVSLIALGLLMPLFTQRKVPTVRMMVILIAAFSLIFFQSMLTKNITPKYIYNEDGIYSNIKIIDRTFNERPARFLQRDTNNSSAIYINSYSLVHNYSKFSLLYKSLVEEPKNILVLGGGAYTIPRALVNLDPDIQIDVVEIEPILFELSQQYFDLHDVSRINNYPMDARVFLKQNTNKKYDLIFGDVFSTDMAAPFHLTTGEFYQLVAQNLSPDGIFMLNIAGIPETTQPSLSGSVAKTLTAVFPNTKTYSLEKDPGIFQNIVFIARNNQSPINLSSWDLNKVSPDIKEYLFTEERLLNEITLTDDHSPVEYLASKQR